MPTKRGENWQGRVRINRNTYTKDGFETKREAQDWERKKRKEVLSFREHGVLDLLTLTTEYCTYAKKYTNNTYREKHSLCKKLLARWGKDITVEELSENPKMILDYLTDRMMEEFANPKIENPRQKPNAANRDRKNLLAMWNYGVQFFPKSMKHLDNPIINVPKFSHKRKPQYVPLRADVLKLKAVCTFEEWVYLATMAMTGGRRSEINHCTVADLDLPNKKIKLWNRKGRDGSIRERWVDISDELCELLKRWLKIRPIKDTEYLFYVLDERSIHYGKPFTTRRRFLRGLCKRAGIREMGYHAIRRHVASYLADRNVPTKYIQEVLGHASMTTTEKYIYRIRNAQREYANLLQTGEEFDKAQNDSLAEK